ncbi:MAG: T9SS type A sorting domain-containing protein [Bacteroidales bacterium]|nr:T9SS type A sorting domain-containing protein [Bacteroidales bacterium]
MKRFVFATLLAMMSTAVMAQEYVRIDTVIRPYIHFDHQAWTDSGKPLMIWAAQLSFDYNLSRGIPETRAELKVQPGDEVQYNYIEGGAEIYGLEAWMIMYDITTSRLCPSAVAPSPTEYLFLYDAKPDTFELKAQVPIMANDSAPYVWIYRFPVGDTTCTGSMNVIPQVDLLQYRYFFDKPIHVDDSFYVGGSERTVRWMEMLADGVQELPPHIIFLYGCMSTKKLYEDPDMNKYAPDECQMPDTKTKVRWADIDYIPGGATMNNPPPGYTPEVWVPSWSNYFWMIFPLIKTYDTIWTVDTPACLPVRDFSIMSRYGDTIMLRWSPLEGRSEFQVSYGPEGMDPDSGTLVNVTTNRWRFIDSLHTGEVMTAYVRTVCRELDTLRFSEWSEGVEWQTRVGIVQPDEDVRLTSRIHLQPNPAKERVEVVTPCGVKGIEVYGSYGIRWREFPAGTADFDVSDWAKGTYVVVIRTLAGSVTKKLVVE